MDNLQVIEGIFKRIADMNKTEVIENDIEKIMETLPDKKVELKPWTKLSKDQKNSKIIDYLKINYTGTEFMTVVQFVKRALEEKQLKIEFNQEEQYITNINGLSLEPLEIITKKKKETPKKVKLDELKIDN
jgi:hypothetical protein